MTDFTTETVRQLTDIERRLGRIETRDNPAGTVGGGGGSSHQPATGTAPITVSVGQIVALSKNAPLVVSNGALALDLSYGLYISNGALAVRLGPTTVFDQNGGVSVNVDHPFVWANHHRWNVGATLWSPDPNGTVVNPGVTQGSGWSIINPTLTGDALLTIPNILVGNLHAKTFIADVMRADVGEEIWTRSRAMLYQDFTTPSVLNTTGVLHVEVPPGLPAALPVFGNTHYIRLRIFNIGTSAQIADAWGTVTFDHYTASHDREPATQTYIFRLLYGDTSAVILKGAVALDYGLPGDAVIYLTTIAKGQPYGEYIPAAAPYIDFFTWGAAGGNQLPWNPANLHLITRIGALDGMLDTSFGLMEGAGLYASNVYLKGAIQIAQGSTGYAFLDDTPATLAEIDEAAAEKLGTIAWGATFGATAEQAAKLAGIDDNATKGAIWGLLGEGGNMVGIPIALTDGRVAVALNDQGTVKSRVVPLSAIGMNPDNSPHLYLGSDRMGFHNGATWLTYMDSLGHFYLVGTGTQGLAWDGTTLSIVGQIQIMPGTVGYANIGGKPANLSDINVAEGGKLAGIATGATVGAVWPYYDGLGNLVSGNITAIPGRFGEDDTPGATGLYLTPNYMGYWNFAEQAWKAYMDAYGNFVFSAAPLTPINGSTRLTFTSASGILGGERYTWQNPPYTTAGDGWHYNWHADASDGNFYAGPNGEVILSNYGLSLIGYTGTELTPVNNVKALAFFDSIANAKVNASKAHARIWGGWDVNPATAQQSLLVDSMIQLEVGTDTDGLIETTAHPSLRLMYMAQGAVGGIARVLEAYDWDAIRLHANHIGGAQTIALNAHDVIVGGDFKAFNIYTTGGGNKAIGTNADKWEEIYVKTVYADAVIAPQFIGQNTVGVYAYQGAGGGIPGGQTNFTIANWLNAHIDDPAMHAVNASPFVATATAWHHLEFRIQSVGEAHDFWFRLNNTNDFWITHVNAGGTCVISGDIFLDINSYVEVQVSAGSTRGTYNPSAVFNFGAYSFSMVRSGTQGSIGTDFATNVWAVAQSQLLQSDIAGNSEVLITNADSGGTANLRVQGKITSTPGIYNDINLVDFERDFRTHIGATGQHNAVDAGSAEQTYATISSVQELELLLDDIVSGGQPIVTSHHSLTGLTVDDHLQYVHTSVNRTIPALHTFAPNLARAPFALGVNSYGQLVTGLNADYLDGHHWSEIAIGATAIRDQLVTVDGAGFGLDADFLDGRNGTGYAYSDTLLSAGDGLLGGGVLGVPFSFSLNTPGILSVSSINAAADNHTHAVTSSSSPGATVTLLATDDSGYLQLVRLGLGVALTVALDVVGDIKIATNGDAITVSTYKGTSSIGKNIWIGNVGRSSIADIWTYKGSYSVAVGVDALLNNTLGYRNTAIGYEALKSNTEGVGNVAVGSDAALGMTTGVNNTAVGASSLYSNTTAIYNTAVGASALYLNVTGNYNTAVGHQALYYTTTAKNVAVGVNALYYNVGGTENVGIGYKAGSNPANDIAQYRIISDTAMTLIGHGATKNNAATLTNPIAIGHSATILESNQIVLGNSSITSVLFNGTLGTISGSLTVSPADHLYLNPTNLVILSTGKIIQSDGASSGYVGTGWQLSQTNGGTLLVNHLFVRGTMTVYDLLIQKIRSGNGSYMFTSGGKVSDVTMVTPNTVYTLTFDEDHGFAYDDLIRAQKFTGSGTYQCNCTVISVTSSKILAVMVIAPSPNPAIGMEFVRLGNGSDPNRQGGIYITSDDSGAPFIDIFGGINDWGDWNSSAKTKTRLGHLVGITGIANEYGMIAGSGVADTDAYLRFSNVGARFNNIAIKMYSGGQQKVNIDAAGTDVWFGSGSADKRLSWNGATLTVVGAITVTGGNALITGSAAADVNANSTTINGGKITAYSITTEQLNFSVVGTSNVIASINTSIEGIRIASSRIHIDGSVTFTAGYDPTGKIATGGAANDINVNATYIDGGKIVAYSITATQIATETITAELIAVSTITATQIAAGTITADKLNVTALSAVTTETGTLTIGAGGYITAGYTTLDSSGIDIQTSSSWNPDSAYTFSIGSTLYAGLFAYQISALSWYHVALFSNYSQSTGHSIDTAKSSTIDIIAATGATSESGIHLYAIHDASSIVGGISVTAYATYSFASIATDRIYLFGTVYGSNAANGDITIEGTSHATKTTSYVLLQPNGGNVGIGTPTPAGLLQAGSAAHASNTVYGQSFSTGNQSGIVSTAPVRITDNTTSYAALRAEPSMYVASGKTLTNYIGLAVSYMGGVNNAGTITNAYGLYINTPAVGTNKYGAYIEGNVGIGTTTPGANLHVQSNVTASMPAVSGTTQAGQIFRIQGIGTTAVLDFGYGGSGKFWITSTNTGNLGEYNPILLQPNGGNVGIGTTAPAEKLHVHTEVQVTARFSRTGGYLNILSYYDSTYGSIIGTYFDGPSDAPLSLAAPSVQIYQGCLVVGTTGNVGAGNIHATGNISGLSITDRPGSYDGDAIADIEAIQLSASGKIIHETMPAQTLREHVEHKTDSRGRKIIVTSKERNMTYTLDMLIIANKQLAARVKELEAKLN